MYQKPTIFKTEDLTEGVYAASGSSRNTVSFRSNGFQPYWSGDSNNGTITYTVTIPSAYVGKHVKLTLNFKKSITSCYGSGSVSVSGTTAVYESWGISRNETITAASGHGDPGLQSVTIAKV